MKTKTWKKILGTVLSAVIATSTILAIPTGNEVKAASIAAFPGAEGGGMYTTGARASSAPTIYRVTSLADDGSEGTLRDAVSGDNRIVVFDVAGNIELTSRLKITGNNITILGQTAPGDGICIKDYPVAVAANNVIMRYLRFRMGTVGMAEDDALGGRFCEDIIIDHCSISWSVDECASFYENRNFTMQWCIVSESLKNSIHAKEAHGYGGVWGGYNATFHHNLIAHHDSRNPRVGSSLDKAEWDEESESYGTVDLRNNVVYNWGANSAYGGENGFKVNLVNCYYKYGPATKASTKAKLFQVSATDSEDERVGAVVGWGTYLYLSGNYVYGSDEVTNDNTKGVVLDSNAEDYIVSTTDVQDEYIYSYPVTTQSAQDAYEDVLASAGASIVRDSVDTRVVNDVRSGSYTYGNNGIIDSPDDVGGYPELNGTKAVDTDGDGMPNEWEDLKGLNKYDASDAVMAGNGGYLNIEIYANALADGSYTRDTDYDTNLSDNTNADSDMWSASENVLANATLISGLTPVSDLTYTASEKTINDKTFTGYVSSSANGKWSDGAATGTALKYTATANGTVTVYLADLGSGKVAYATKAGASDYKTKSVASVTGTGANATLTFEVKKAETYYIYVAGSKGRFAGVAFDKDTTVYSWSAANDVTANTALMTTLVPMTDLTYTQSAQTISGKNFEGYVSSSESGKWSNGAATGTALKYTAPKSGILTVYIADLGLDKVAYITREGVSDYKTGSVSSITGTGADSSISAYVEAGETYYVYVAGSKGRFCGADLTVMSADESVSWTASEAFTNELTSVTDLTYTASEETISGKDFEGYVSSSESGKWSSGVATGTALKFVAPKSGILTAYIADLGDGKIAYITEEGVSDYKTASVSSVTGTGANSSISGYVEEGKTYYIYVAGSKGRFSGVDFN